MMNERDSVNRAMVIVGGLLAVCTAAVLLWGQRTRSAGTAQLSPLAQAGVPADGGAPVQRARIDDFAARVAREDTFEALAAGLDEHEDLLVTVSMWSQEPMPEQMFEVCLANRRLARLFGILQHRADADSACRNLFNEKLAVLRNGFVRGLEAWERGVARSRQERPDLEPPREGVESVEARVKGWNEIYERGDPPKEFFDSYAAVSAVSAAVFLSAEFSPVEEVLRQLDAWTALGNELTERCDVLGDWVPSSMRPSIEYYAYPQQRFQFSLLASLLQRRFGIDPGGTSVDDTEAIEAIRALGGRLRRFDAEGRVPNWAYYRRLPLCTWNATTNPLDFTHVARGVPVDARERLGEFLVFQNMDVTGSPDERQRILDDLRKRLLAAAAEEEGQAK